jgi:hypothetical protein
MDATFTHALQVETAMLQAAHPILAEQLARAHALIADGLVWPEDDGKSFMVQSSTDPATWYSCNGHCQCKASEYRPEPCKHRMSARLYQRVCERLAEESECYDLTQDPAAPVATPLPEAPASVNVRLCISGRDVQWTLRDVDEERLAARLEALLARYPVEMASTNGSAPVPQIPACKYHGTMKASTKAPGSFYCTKKLHDGSYCGERFPEKSGAHEPR